MVLCQQLPDEDCRLVAFSRLARLDSWEDRGRFVSATYTYTHTHTHMNAKGGRGAVEITGMSSARGEQKMTSHDLQK